MLKGKHLSIRGGWRFSVLYQIWNHFIVVSIYLQPKHGGHITASGKLGLCQLGLLIYSCHFTLSRDELTELQQHKTATTHNSKQFISDPALMSEHQSTHWRSPEMLWRFFSSYSSVLMCSCSNQSYCVYRCLIITWWFLRLYSKCINQTIFHHL